MLRVFSLLACLLCLGGIQTSSAQNCGWRAEIFDTLWSFQANAGATHSRYFVIGNTTNSPIAVEYSITGTGHEAFDVVPHIDTLPVGDTTSVQIIYHPGSGSATNTHHSAKLTIHRIGMDCSEHLNLVGTVTGNSSGHSAADSLITDPHEFTFGAIKEDSTACRTVTVTNYSSKSMTLTGWNQCESNQFSINPPFNDSNRTLGPGASITFTICYTPDSSHASGSCNLTIHYTVSGSSEGHTRLISFGGTRSGNDHGGGDHNILSSDPHEFSFGAVAFGDDSCRTITIRNNDSNSTAIITGFTHCDGHNFSFTPSSLSDTLAPGESVQITICFIPDSIHTQSTCNLTVNYITLNPLTDGHHLVVNFSGTRAGADNGHDACIRTEQSNGFRDAVVLGASADRTLILINPTGASVTISADSIACEDRNAFSALNSQFPITIAAHSQATFSYSFTPFSVSGHSKNAYEACVFFSVSGDSINCHLFRGVLVGFGAHDHIDSMPHPMFPTEKRILAIEANGVRPVKTFEFINNLNVVATVKGISIEQDGQFFDIQSVHPEVLPAALKPGEIFSVTIALIATDNKPHVAKLKIEADHALAAQEFEIQGLNTSNASVRNGLPQGVTLSVSPNPMTTNLTVTTTGIGTATVEVYDMLGKQLTSAPLTTTWKWDATSNGSLLSSGSYIVRISGLSEANEQFVTSKMVIVQ